MLSSSIPVSFADSYSESEYDEILSSLPKEYLDSLFAHVLEVTEQDLQVRADMINSIPESTITQWIGNAGICFNSSDKTVECFRERFVTETHIYYNSMGSLLDTETLIDTFFYLPLDIVDEQLPFYQFLVENDFEDIITNLTDDQFRELFNSLPDEDVRRILIDSLYITDSKDMLDDYVLSLPNYLQTKFIKADI